MCGLVAGYSFQGLPVMLPKTDRPPRIPLPAICPRCGAQLEGVFASRDGPTGLYRCGSEYLGMKEIKMMRACGGATLTKDVRRTSSS